MFVKLFIASDRKVRDFRLPILGESCPRKLLPDSLNAVKFLQEYMLSGIVPLKLLYRRSKVFRLCRVEKLTLASSPMKLLFLRLMVFRFVQLPSDDGSSPDMLFWSK
ncbi:hypothetical protein PVAP13_1NG020708 [Panicum virgatum]|uniref:Uncharacterized protein n=1 Tax=Panicum virgatum TaxID=38727 RepID=A0A8T0WTY7_PANVG|nr:hypothetical protein PVAP13_1NG020708 [Panicum virgatum]